MKPAKFVKVLVGLRLVAFSTAMLLGVGRVASESVNQLADLLFERYSANVRSRLLPVATLGAEKYTPNEHLQWQYIHSFFRGYRHGLEGIPGAISVGAPEDATQRGFDHGFFYYRTLKSDGSQPFDLSDFGYTTIVVRGLYGGVYGKVGFRPAGSAEEWWVDFQSGALEKYLGEDSARRTSVFRSSRSVEFRGNLSPDDIGFAGHLNQYDRRLIVSDINHIEGYSSTQPSKSGDTP